MSQPTVLSPVIKLSQSMDNPEPSNTAATDIKRLQKRNSLPAMPSSTLGQCKVNAKHSNIRLRQGGSICINFIN